MLRDRLSAVLKERRHECINVRDEEELHYWSTRFGATPEQIQAASRAVLSTAVPDVERYLRRMNS